MPAAHLSAHAVVLVVALLYVPAAHTVQLVEPVAAWYRPISHTKHNDDVVDEVYRPEPQDVHKLAPALEYLPVEHGYEEKAESPVEAQ